MYRSFKGLFGLISREQKKTGFLCLGVMLVLGFMEILSAALIVMVPTRLTAAGERADIVLLTAVCVGVFVVKGCLDSYAQNKWIQGLILDFKRRLVGRYTKMDYAYQITQNSGNTLSTLYHDADIYMRIGLSSIGCFPSKLHGPKGVKS